MGSIQKPEKVKLVSAITFKNRDEYKETKNILKNHPGNCAAFLHLLLPGRSETIISLPDEFRLNPSEGLFQEMEYLFGRRVVTLN